MVARRAEEDRAMAQCRCLRTHHLGPPPIPIPIPLPTTQSPLPAPLLLYRRRTARRRRAVATMAEMAEMAAMVAMRAQMVRTTIVRKTEMSMKMITKINTPRWPQKRTTKVSAVQREEATRRRRRRRKLKRAGAVLKGVLPRCTIATMGRTIVHLPLRRLQKSGLLVLERVTKKQGCLLRWGRRGRWDIGMGRCKWAASIEKRQTREGWLTVRMITEMPATVVTATGEVIEVAGEGRARVRKEGMHILYTALAEMSTLAERAATGMKTRMGVQPLSEKLSIVPLRGQAPLGPTSRPARRIRLTRPPRLDREAVRGGETGTGVGVGTRMVGGRETGEAAVRRVMRGREGQGGAAEEKRISIIHLETGTIVGVATRRGRGGGVSKSETRGRMPGGATDSTNIAAGRATVAARGGRIKTEMETDSETVEAPTPRSTLHLFARLSRDLRR